MRDLLFLKNQKGQMLIQVMITSAIMGVIMMSIATMMSAQSKTAQMITQKLGVNDLQQMLSTSMNSGNSCKAIIDSLGASANFNASLVGSATPPKISLNKIPMSADPTAPDLVTIGSQPSALTNALVVKSIELVITGGTGNQFRGNLQVVFDETKLIVPLRPASVGVLLQTNGGGNPTISSCKPDPGTGGGGELPGTPCDGSYFGRPGKTGFLMYNWSTDLGLAEKLCCMGDQAATAQSRGFQSQNGRFANIIFICTAWNGPAT
ncbi:MAG: hypothetical protein AB7H97_14035 [Pseudobdellovibrionaceae bacterium]